MEHAVSPCDVECVLYHVALPCSNFQLPRDTGFHVLARSGSPTQSPIQRHDSPILPSASPRNLGLPDGEIQYAWGPSGMVPGGRGSVVEVSFHVLGI